MTKSCTTVPLLFSFSLDLTFCAIFSLGLVRTFFLPKIIPILDEMEVMVIGMLITAAQTSGFLVFGWIVQFIKPRGRILIGGNIIVGLGFFAGYLYYSFTCDCNIVSTVVFIGFSFLFCFGRIGSFLLCTR